jgi:RNA polymerase sigma-70 factor (ECF subfamily)
MPKTKIASGKRLISDEDISLIDRIVKRDYQALERVYDKYQRKVFSVVLRIVKTEEDAREMQQDVFLTIWQKAALFNSSLGSLSAWIMTIAHNTAINGLRSKLAKQRKLEIKQDHQTLSELVIERTIERRTPLDDQVESDEKKYLHDLLEQIPANQRTILMMSYFDGYSQSQIAKALGQPLGSVKSSMRQGRIKLYKLATLSKIEAQT